MIPYACPRCPVTFDASAHIDPDRLIDAVEAHEATHAPAVVPAPRRSRGEGVHLPVPHAVPVTWYVAVGGALVLGLLVMLGVGVGAIS